jgi:hypothetical protein
MGDRATRPLPVTLEEIDCAWLAAALRPHSASLGLQSFEIVDVKRGTCTKLRLRLNLDSSSSDAGLPDTVILKGGFEPHSRALYFMHEMEVRGYRDVFPVLRLRTPACYFADYDAERLQGIVIMEDLVARNVTFCSPLKPHTHNQVARRLTALARFHAQTWELDDLGRGKWGGLSSPVAELPAYFRPYLEPDAWQRLIDSPRGAAASVHFHDRKWMARALEILSSMSSRLPHCVVHGDTHLGNLYIEADGTPGFFDGVPSRAPAMMEISYHIAGALDPIDRQRWDGALIRHYLDELERNGITPPDYDEAMRQYSAYLVYGYCVFLVNESFFQSEANNTAYTARFSAAMKDHDSVAVLDAMA